jgi:hypothetical protein
VIQNRCVPHAGVLEQAARHHAHTATSGNLSTIRAAAAHQADSARGPGVLPKTIRYFRPFMQFDLRVLTDGRELVVMRGDFDGPASPAELQLPAGGTGRLETPVTLRFAAKAASDSDALQWTVVGEPRSVELRATLRIEHESFRECIAHVDRM